MTEVWPCISVGSLVQAHEAALQTGPFGTQLSASEYVPEGIPVINVRNVGFGDVRADDLEYVSEGKAEQLHHHVLRAGDIVFGRKGAVERHALIGSAQDGWVQGSDCLRLRLRSSRFNVRFVSFYLRTKGHQDWMQALCSFGATMSSLNQDIVNRIELPCPPRPVQDQIAAVLAAYDDLIANNQRRIALLESLAEEIYREWFVRMRFPGAKSAVFDKGMPTDWTHEPVLDAFKFYGGATPAKDNPRFWVDGEVHWYTPTDITGASSPYLEESADKCTDEGLQNCSANLFPAHSIMMTSRATIGAIGINSAPACTNQGFITCIPNQRYPLTYLYHWLKLAKPHFEMLSGGATFAELTKGTFKRIRILTPPVKLVAAYEQQARPMFDEVESLTKMNRRLRATRDSLLPRLISGKLRVEALDIQFPPSMQPPPAEAAPREAIAR
ncbi:restriction endonuclease subunit S [Ideonella dechloratans]|uniref:Restriction endonuclease subunit S n=1 Tax=Ideonella dechloratans TaxID=36863 RepID=A0A643F7N8_IDEDE|nr:restriction endonuclease subunit S [Ideonella dechloratans]KAB0576290.1 restriction endonuclease subunit S [Ideonella dechloratans]UFU10146.1 restriction endonuclease subunit S [Ideonella dechloratans]